MMTREEAYKKLCKLPVGHTMDYIALAPAKNLIDEIFDQQDKLEAELKTKDERIEAQSSVIIACQNAILQKDERIAELETERDKYNTIAANLQISRQKAYDNIAELEANLKNMCATCGCAKFTDKGNK